MNCSSPFSTIEAITVHGTFNRCTSWNTDW